MNDDKIDFKKTPFLVVVDIGARDTGKTTDTLQWIDEYMSSRKNGRAFIFLTVDHKKYKQFREIKVNEIPAVKKGVCKIISNDFDQIFKYINNRKFTDAYLTFEDATSYLTDSTLPKAVKKFIVDSKQKNLHLVFQFHGWGFVQPAFFRICDFLKIHKTGDSPEGKERYIALFDPVEQVYLNVQSATGPKWYSEEIRIGA